MRSVEEILQSTSDALFPADLGNRRVAIDSRGCDGDTPLHVLLWRKDTDGTKLLIAAGADTNAVGDMGETPLHVAVSQELLDVIEALLSAGASPDIRSEFGDTPRERAAARGGVAAELLKRAAPNNSFKPNPLRGSA
jgi:ankyrin repeat protein